MNWPKRKAFSILLLPLLAAVLYVTGCGVKGDPLPPEKPVELGRGRPTYKRATEGMAIEKNKPARAKPADDDEEDDDEQK